MSFLLIHRAHENTSTIGCAYTQDRWFPRVVVSSSCIRSAYVLEWFLFSSGFWAGSVRCVQDTWRNLTELVLLVEGVRTATASGIKQ